MILSAQYTAWAIERETREAERGRIEAERADWTQRPEIQGTLSWFRAHGTRGEATFAYGRRTVHMGFACTVDVCNVRPVTTNVKAVLLLGAELEPSPTSPACHRRGATLDIERISVRSREE